MEISVNAAQVPLGSRSATCVIMSHSGVPLTMFLSFDTCGNIWATKDLRLSNLYKGALKVWLAKPYTCLIIVMIAPNDG